MGYLYLQGRCGGLEAKEAVCLYDDDGSFPDSGEIVEVGGCLR